MFRDAFLHKLFTETIYLFIFIIFLNFFGENFISLLDFTIENFLKLAKKNGKNSTNENYILKKEKKKIMNLENLQKN